MARMIRHRVSMNLCLDMWSEAYLISHIFITKEDTYVVAENIYDMKW